MEVTSDTAKLLLEIGLMAAWRGDTIDARTILEGLQPSRPESPYPNVGLAVAYMNEGRFELAVQVLEDGLVVDEDCEVVLCHLALACKVMGFDDRSNKLCQKVIAAGRDETAVELARMLQGVPVNCPTAINVPC